MHKRRLNIDASQTIRVYVENFVEKNKNISFCVIKTPRSFIPLSARHSFSRHFTTFVNVQKTAYLSGFLLS
jgi:hypothetical protein